jgi:hypothetical protein
LQGKIALGILIPLGIVLSVWKITFPYGIHEIPDGSTVHEWISMCVIVGAAILTFPLGWFFASAPPPTFEALAPRCIVIVFNAYMWAYLLAKWIEWRRD